MTTATDEATGQAEPEITRSQRLDRAVRRLTSAGVREILIASGVSALVMVAWVIIMPVALPRDSGGDAIVYKEMAADPTGNHWAPLAFRVLEPWLAHSIGALIGGESGHLVALRYLSWTAQALTGPAVYLLTRRFHGGHGAGLLAVAGTLSLPMWLFLVYQPHLVDGMAMMTMAWTMLALVNGWVTALPVLLVLMGLARETVMGFAVPIYMWLRHRWIDLHTGVQTVLLIAPALIVVWAIRQPMTFTGYQSMPGLMYSGLNYVKNDVLPEPHKYLLYGIAASLGIWWLLGIYGRRHTGRLWWMLVPVFAQWLFGSDWARYALYAFPVVIPAAAIAVWAHHRRGLLLGLIALQSGVILVDNYVQGHPGIYGIYPSTWISVGLMIPTALALWWPKRTAPLPRELLETAR